MAREYSSFQRKVIQAYYRNRDAIEVQRLQELVGEIYLAANATRRTKLWERARQLLERIPGLTPAAVNELVAAQDVETLAEIASERFLGD